MQNETSHSQDSMTSTATTPQANGKWVSKESYDALIERGSTLLTTATSSTAGFLRQYPVQAAIGGVILGVALGAILFRSSSSTTTAE